MTGGGVPSGSPGIECTSTRTIDRWEVQCGRRNRHVVHQTQILDERGAVITLDWDDRPLWRSDLTKQRLERERAERRRRANRPTNGGGA